MLAKRIIPCLDVKAGRVVKGVQFRNHEIVGDILQLAEFYCYAGADELVFYDITASSDQRTVDRQWINQIAKRINIPFCVAGGIRTIDDAVTILNQGADKISINSPALENPQFIEQLVKRFGSQCVVIGIDSFEEDGQYWVHQYTGDEKKVRRTSITTEEWVKKVQEYGAGEIVLNCMNCDGVRNGYDLKQLRKIRSLCQIPLIASGGAGEEQHFFEVFNQTQVDGALAASVFHRGVIEILSLKQFLQEKKIRMRI